MKKADRDRLHRMEGKRPKPDHLPLLEVRDGETAEAALRRVDPEGRIRSVGLIVPEHLPQTEDAIAAWSAGAVERQAQQAVVEQVYVQQWREAHPRPEFTQEPGAGLPVVPDALPGLEVVTDADGVARVIGKKLVR